MTILKRKVNLSSLSIEELWVLHEEVGILLSDRITVEKRNLENRLAQLNTRNPDRLTISPELEGTKRRKYPPVPPKFENPSDPTETWAGRGKQPRWLVSQLEAGKKMNDFLIDRDSA